MEENKELKLSLFIEIKDLEKQKEVFINGLMDRRKKLDEEINSELKAIESLIEEKEKALEALQ